MKRMGGKTTRTRAHDNDVIRCDDAAFLFDSLMMIGEGSGLILVIPRVVPPDYLPPQ
jgi:hypothetical protein